MRVNVKDKVIDTSKIKNLFVQGEANATQIDFVVDPQYSGLDWQMRGVYEYYGAAAVQPLAKTESTAEIVVSWLVSNLFTAGHGQLHLALTGTNAGGSVVVKAIGDVEIKRDYALDGMPNVDENLFEQLMAEVGAAVQEAEAAQTAAETAEDNAEASATAAAGSATEAAESATDAAEAQAAAELAVTHYPRVNSTNGNWEVWNAQSGAYQDTGVPATGEGLEFAWGNGENLYKLGVRREGESAYTYSVSLRGEPGDSSAPHAARHASGGSDPITPEAIGALKSSIGSVANLPLFTGAGGAIGVKSIADALAALGIPVESGTWTPAMASSAIVYSAALVASGNYIRIANLCYIYGSIQCRVSDPGGAQVVLIGLPYIPLRTGVLQIVGVHDITDTPANYGYSVQIYPSGGIALVSDYAAGCALKASGGGAYDQYVMFCGMYDIGGWMI